jgi:hypothetical protein
MIGYIECVALKMWSKKDMPEAKKGADGKIEKDPNTGKIINTGNTIEYTEYVFRDLMGETLKIMSANNKFRDLENKEGTLFLNIEKKEFMGKTETRVSLKDFIPGKKN